MSLRSAVEKSLFLLENWCGDNLFCNARNKVRETIKEGRIIYVDFFNRFSILILRHGYNTEIFRIYLKFCASFTFISALKLFNTSE